MLNSHRDVLPSSKKSVNNAQNKLKFGNILKFGNSATIIAIAYLATLIVYVKFSQYCTINVNDRFQWSFQQCKITYLATMLEIASRLEVCQQWRVPKIVDKLLRINTLTPLFESLLLLMSFKLKEFSHTNPFFVDIAAESRRKYLQSLIDGN